MLDEVCRDISHGEDAAAQADGLAGESIGVPGPIEPLVVLQHDGNDLSIGGDWFSAPRPLSLVVAHGEGPFPRQASGLVQDHGRYADLSNVMEQPPAVQPLQPLGPEFQFSADL